VIYVHQFLRMQGNCYGVMSFIIIIFNSIGMCKHISIDVTSLFNSCLTFGRARPKAQDSRIPQMLHAFRSRISQMLKWLEG
jgi:hypothetical protein